MTVEGGTPALGASAGGEAAVLAYASGSGSAVLVFSRAVTESDGSLSQVAVTADSLALGGATIVSAASGLAAELGHDGTEPTAPPQAAEPEALTASFTAVPDSHGGEPFTLELTFSESPEMSYRALRRVDGQEGKLWVSYGTVSKVRRIEQGSNAGWRITIEPEGGQDVVVRLPAQPDCGVAGAICTSDGRGLAADVTAVVPEAVSAETPFRVRLKDVPKEHDGSGEIAFEVVFNKAPADYSYATLRDATLRIARDGTALAPKVRRLLEGADRNREWAVTVVAGRQGGRDGVGRPVCGVFGHRRGVHVDGRGAVERGHGDDPGPAGAERGGCAGLRGGGRHGGLRGDARARVATHRDGGLCDLGRDGRGGLGLRGRVGDAHLRGGRDGEDGGGGGAERRP